MLDGNAHRKHSNCKKRVLDSKNALYAKKCSECSEDVQTSLVTPQTSSPLCRGQKCSLRYSHMLTGLKQSNKGVTNHQNTWAKALMLRIEKGPIWKRKWCLFEICARFAWICARFPPSLHALQPCFLKNDRFAMTNGTASWKSAQRSQHLTNYLMMFHVQSDPATYECTRNTH